MKEHKHLIKNVGLMTISNFGGKILSFLLVPLYTNVLSTAQYGTYDLYLTTILLFTPVLSINIIDAVMRFSLDKNEKKKDIFTVGLYHVLLAIVIFTVAVCINDIFGIIPVFTEYSHYLIIYFALYLFYDLLFQFARGLDRIFDCAVGSIINSASVLGLNLLFLLVFKWGLEGYFLANIIAFAASVVYFTIRLQSYKQINLRFSDKKLKRDMQKYSFPMVFNTIGWWINNVSDRYVITFINGISANGQYSVAYKIPSILNVFQSTFVQAWVLSAVETFEDEETAKRFYSEIYRLYNFLMVFVCSLLIMFDKIIAKILFAKEFYEAWRFAPFLLISVLFGAMSGFLGGIFSAAKNTKTFAKSTVIGAVINTVLNIVLVSKFGPIGAAVATMVSYFIVWVIRLIETNKIIKFKIYLFRDTVCYIILLIQSLLLLYTESITLQYLVNAVLVLFILALNFREFKDFAVRVTDKLKERKKSF